MNLKAVIVIFACLPGFLNVSGQTCTGLGQNPETAFPVCGTNAFVQNTVPLCGGRKVPGPSCPDDLTDINPYWYKFTCFTSGTLGFVITPNNLDDDYDWQLFDITGRDPKDIYNDATMIVGSNWSGEPGITGASTTGRAINVCGGLGKPLFSTMPSIIKDHEYLLLVSHFTNTQSGYKLSFGGSSGSTTNGTANITDPQPPLLESAAAKCDAIQITVTLNKKMRCNSLASDGSDFQLVSGNSTIIGAASASCVAGFDMKTLVLTLSTPLQPGTYKLLSKKGSDANTIADYCGNTIPEAQEISFVVNAVQPTPMDSLQAVKCAPAELKLIFRNNVRCNSIAPNGSDFQLTGPSSIRITGATGACDANGYTSSISLHLSAPIQTGGSYKVTLVNGDDLNTIIDECSQLTPAGSAIDFVLKDTVSAVFNYTIFPGCKTDTVAFVHDGLNGVDSWKWSMDDNKSSTLQNPEAYYSRFGEKRVSLIVTNGFCSDTVNQTINLDNAIDAKFSYPEIVCPEEPATFTDASTGKIDSWNWSFGNGFSGTSQNPSPQPYTVPPLTRELKYNVSLIIGNTIGCYDTSTISLKAVSSCYIAVPSAFTPNRDGVNDYLYPLNAFKATDLIFKVFNRYGQIVFETTDWTGKWDGTIKGKNQPSGTYVWTLSYTESDTGKNVSVKGSSTLIR